MSTSVIPAPPASPDLGLFRKMLDRLPVAAYACDADGLITYFNAKAVELWGRAPTLNHDDDRYCGSYRLLSPDGHPIDHHDSWMAFALRNGREYLAQEILVERPDGSLTPVLAYATPLLDEHGRVVAALNILVNISERKRFERLLRDANEVKNQYMATLADELRAQLSAMQHSLDLVEHSLKRPDDGCESIDIQLMRTGMREMSSLVEDLLALPSQARPPELATRPRPHLHAVPGGKPMR